MLPSQPSSAARPAPAAIRRGRSCGARRSTSTRWTTPPTSRCSATSPMRRSTITACARFFPQGRQVPGRDRRAGRQARHVRDQVHVRPDPLQQYLIEFPDGRLQALSIAWDSWPKDVGGQRWFHLYPDEDQARRHPALDQAEPELELHVRRVPLDRRASKTPTPPTTASPPASPRSAWVCEACHGRGSRHAALGAFPAELVAVRLE